MPSHTLSSQTQSHNRHIKFARIDVCLLEPCLVPRTKSAATDSTTSTSTAADSEHGVKFSVRLTNEFRNSITRTRDDEDEDDFVGVDVSVIFHSSLDDDDDDDANSRDGDDITLPVASNRKIKLFGGKSNYFTLSCGKIWGLIDEVTTATTTTMKRASISISLTPKSSYHLSHKDFVVIPVRTRNITVLRSLNDSGTPVVIDAELYCSRAFVLPFPLQIDRDSLSLSSAKTITIKESYGTSLGAHVWDCALILSSLIYTHSTTTTSTSLSEGVMQHLNIRNKSVIDLGAGCGLTGITAHMTGARSVCLTEAVLTGGSLAMMGILEGNVRRYVDGVDCDSGEKIKYICTEKLNWEDAPCERLAGKFDTVVASDVLYCTSKALWAGLVRCAGAVLRARFYGDEEEDEGEGGGEKNERMLIIAQKHRTVCTKQQELIVNEFVQIAKEEGFELMGVERFGGGVDVIFLRFT